MGIVFRQSVKNIAVTGLGVMLGAVIIWLTTEYVPKRGLGFIGNFTGYAVLGAQVLLLGLNNTLAVYIHRYAADDRKRKLLITLSIVVPGAATVLLTALYFLFKSAILNHFQPEDIPLMRAYFAWLPLFILLFIYMILLEQYLASQMKVAISAFMREVLLRVLNVGLILLFATGVISFHFLVIGTVLIYFVPVLVLLLMAARTRAFGLSTSFSDFSTAEYKDIASYSWFHFLFTFSNLLLVTMDVTLLPFYDHNGFRSVAVYRVALYFISFLLFPLKAMLPASFPPFARAFTENDMDKARDIFNRSSLNILIVTVFITVAIYCNLPSLLKMVGEGYEIVTPLFMILSIGSLANVITGMNDQVLSIANYYKFNFYLSLILMAVSFILMRLMIPAYGVYGAAWSTTFTVLSFNVIKYIFVKRKVGMEPMSQGTLKVIIAGAICYIAGYLVPHLFGSINNVYISNGADVALRSAVILALYIALLLWLKPSQDLQDYVASLRKNKRLF